MTRRLIVNADDFGRSRSINEAVIRAHREGILTSASLMMNEEACEEAVELARQNPRLGVGLHLTLLCGHSAISPARISGLVNARGEFSEKPATSGMRYYLNRGLRSQLRDEVHEQFERFRRTGLELDHVNGHLHMHMHPVVFRILMDDWETLGFKRARLTRDRFWLNCRLDGGRWFYRTSHAFIYQMLSYGCGAAYRRRGVRHTQHVFGLMQDSHVDEAYVSKLLPRLPGGDSELYSHPSLDKFKHEFDALVSPRVIDLVKRLGIRLIRYQDL
ncbi:MAG TPA: hopanoid biosynthesis-associated protein HpnK [Verrucomicrobiae bacterium]|nr:hopanoid biosynthesis-associated protein HpnK [Verrucomicrobiae bacterium]